MDDIEFSLISLLRKKLSALVLYVGVMLCLFKTHKTKVQFHVINNIIKLKLI